MTQNDQIGPARPLDGYRVLDFGWVLAGALPGMVLADMGAEVLKVETRQRMDYMRLGRPIVGDEPDPEQHPLFHNVNRGKLSIAINTTKPQAVDLTKDLVVHCDVVVENLCSPLAGFSPSPHSSRFQCDIAAACSLQYPRYICGPLRLKSIISPQSPPF